MVDTGADRDVISECLTKRLDIDVVKTVLRVVTVDHEIITERPLASFSVESMDGEYSALVNEALVGNILTGENEVPPSRRDLSSCPHLSDIDFDEVEGNVEVILGAAHIAAWLPLETRRGGENESLVGVKTCLGWTIAGRLGRSNPDNVAINAISTDNDILRRSLDRIFYHDFSVVSEEELGESRDHIEAVEQLAKSIRFDEEVGKYFVGLPWKYPREEVTKICNRLRHRDTAMKRLKSMIPRFRRDPDRRKRVFAEVQKFIDTGVAIEIDPVDDDAFAPDPRWSMPLHVVIKHGKLRVCHDARAPTGGVCLNDLLLGGPNIINPLAQILMYSRRWKYVLMNDIKAFFHQVRVDPRDVDAFRFPWFNDESLSSARMMAFLSHVFGSAASSIVTAYVLRFHAERIKPDFPPAVYDWIRNRFYVDDGTGGANTAEELIELSNGVIEAMKLGGFQLTKFKSNLPELMEGDASEAVKLGASGTDLDDTTKVLGVSWIPSSDVFTFNFDPELSTKEVNTPRELVSVSSSLYDPLGFISPFVLHGRKMLQRCNAQKIGWDSPLESTLRANFQRWASSIPILADLRLPRWWNQGVDEPKSSQLHVFTDAAPTSGYGAVAYHRVEAPDGSVKVILLCSRSHVVPLDSSRASHHNSAPRLELFACEKGVELRAFVERSVETSFDKICEGELSAFVDPVSLSLISALFARYDSFAYLLCFHL